MGDVYRARDTKLGREVAIKVLHETVAQDKKRIARFEREAHLLASLNHPNIATLHGFEQSGGIHFLVMELVPGETLGKRIVRGPIPVDEALPLFMQVAEALEAAHDKGVVHRDLKPANISVTPEGKAKVLDFGLAKALTEETSAPGRSESPTVTKEGPPTPGLRTARTKAGVILGTAAYMSPEQARGEAVDKRADIWAFGCCLYEALTGKTAFLGETVSDTIASVLKQEPDWKALPDATPGLVHSLLRRCLEKKSAERLHDIADARIELKEALFEPSAPAAADQAALRRSPKQVLPLGALALLAMIAALALWAPWRTRPLERHPSRFETTLPPGQTVPYGDSFTSTVALSPDGSEIVYVAREGDTTQLYRRSIGAFDAEAIPGTEGASAPFLSPDGSWVGFYSNKEVKKVSLQGGALSAISRLEQTTFVGGTWGPDDTVIFSQCTFGLKKVSAAGGFPEVLTSLADFQDDQQHQFPQLLPGGKVVLLTIWNSPEDARIAIRHLDTGEQRTVFEPGTHGRYVPTGHLVYAWAGELLAVPFDLEKLAVTGLPVRVLDNVLMEENRGTAHFSVSDNGSLVYVPGGVVRDVRTLVWVDRTGEVDHLSFPPGKLGFRISPDGTKVLLSLRATRGGKSDLWVYDLERGVRRRFTDDLGTEFWAIWTPDNRRVVYNSRRPGGSLNLYWKPVDGSGPEEILAESEYWLQPFSFSADGKLFAFQEEDPTTGFDIWVLSLEGDGKSHALPPHEAP